MNTTQNDSDDDGPFYDEQFYEFVPPPPHIQHRRLGALRQLTAAGIPCALWGEDALQYVHRVATGLFDQQILVPDDLLDYAASALQNECWVRSAYNPLDLAREEWEPGCGGTVAWPKAIRLAHRDVPPELMLKSTHVVDPLPSHVLLLPQSYYGIDLRNYGRRLRSMVPPLPPSNEGILVPEFHTFLEGLIHFLIHPPAPHRKGMMRHTIYLGYLCSWRVQDDPRNLPVPGELLPEEQKILGELETEDARWFMRGRFMTRESFWTDTIEEYKQSKLAVAAKSNLGMNSMHGLNCVINNVGYAPSSAAVLPHCPFSQHGSGGSWCALSSHHKRLDETQIRRDDVASLASSRSLMINRVWIVSRRHESGTTRL
ncbi:hypothetical protein R3P38DRAFT_2863474 [Favolaschia claudopus]|uniref:Uncharacterized protein n=1 Tax=Favolaschia claudopus TaxID=2862362 RepID=A0AAW0DCC4_9AGAR